MMIDGTPGTESVRDAWAERFPDHEYGEASDRFDLWLASIKAEAWDEGKDAERSFQNRPLGVWWMTKNPYSEK